MELKELLEFSRNNRASDLHLAPNHPPTIRVDGDIKPLRVPELSPEQVCELIYSTMDTKQRAEFEENLELDYAIEANEDRFRVNAFNTLHGVAAAFRRIPTNVKTLHEIGAPKVIKNLATLHKGLILVTGPTGSGKSTTLAAIIDYINNNFPKHILTIEDPIEFIHKSNRSLINQRQLGANTKSFSQALKSAMREDPDVILVGELRDIETINLALTAAETGHLVLATLHTSSAAKTIDRIIDVFPPNDKAIARSMISGSLQAVITQTLVKRCDKEGRIAAYEILIATSAVRNMIRDNKVAQIYSLQQVGKNKGMITMRDTIYGLMDQGIISSNEAQKALSAKDDTEDIGSASVNTNVNMKSESDDQF